MSSEDPKYRVDGQIDGRSIRDPKTRPQKKIDWNLVDELLIAGCLGTEIAARFDMHPTTFYNRVEDQYGMSFTHYSQEKRCCGDSLLRKAQFDKALEKDNTMLIWLGKQRLGQKENHDVSIDSSTVKEFAYTMGWFKQLQEAKKNKPETCPTCETSMREFEGNLFCPNCTKSL